MYCPVCRKITSTHGYILSVNDGGSSMCHDCGSIFHKCKLGYKIGGPGPALCTDCNSTDFSFQSGTR